MKQCTLVSVIITTYNNPLGLERALRSVWDQTYDNIEIIIVDGGDEHGNFRDNDITHTIRTDTSKNKIGGNVQECRNVGVKHAHGKYVAMLDDDDEWDKTKIEKQMKLMQMSYPSLIVTYSMKDRGNFKMIDKPISKPTYDDLLQSFCYSQTSTYLMKKKDLIACGGFNESLRSMHEYDVALRMAKIGMRIDCVNETLVFSSADKLNNKHYFIKIAELLDLWKCYGEDMIKEHVGMIRNAAKTIALLSLYTLGYVIGGAVWKIIFTLKMRLNK